MTIVRKTYEPQYVRIKASGDQGIVSAVVSVFNNVDVQGDRVMRGSFSKSLLRWQASGDRVPVIWSHEWQDPTSHIGFVTSARETTEGLEVTAQLDINENAKAAQIFRLLKERRVTQWSFAYDVLRETKAADGANELLELDLIEVGPTLRGANNLTHTLSAKNAHLAIDHAEAEQRRQDDVKADPRYWSTQFDRITGRTKPQPAEIETPLADALVEEVRAEMVREKLARDRQVEEQHMRDLRAQAMSKVEPEPMVPLTSFAGVIADPDAERLRLEAEQRAIEHQAEREQAEAIAEARRTEGKWVVS